MKRVTAFIEEPKEALDRRQTIQLKAQRVGPPVLLLLTQELILIRLKVFGANLRQLDTLLEEPAEEGARVGEVLRHGALAVADMKRVPVTPIKPHRLRRHRGLLVFLAQWRSSIHVLRFQWLKPCPSEGRGLGKWRRG